LVFGSRSAPPALNAAGIIATARIRKKIIPTCQSWLDNRACKLGAITKVPTELVAATTPSMALRRSSGTARAQAVMHKDDAVQDSAIPINPPEMASARAPCATVITTSPAKYTNVPNTIARRIP